MHAILHNEHSVIGARRRRATTVERFGASVPGSLPTSVRTYKSNVTPLVNELWGSTGERVWQRNYFERVIRNERELNTVRRYIQENPRQWDRDPNKVADI
jgi:REP element-mobilizing transposase RayT